MENKKSSISLRKLKSEIIKLTKEEMLRVELVSKIQQCRTKVTVERNGNDDISIKALVEFPFQEYFFVEAKDKEEYIIKLKEQILPHKEINDEFLDFYDWVDEQEKIGKEISINDWHTGKYHNNKSKKESYN